MNSEKLDLNIQDLQRNAIDLLKQSSSLLGRAIEVCSSDSLSQKYAKFQQEVTNATRKVEELELKMAIVAPMKAGKSTIINAIVGQELLPSRNEAMTTLPTELVFKANLKEPVLILSEQTQVVLQQTIAALKDTIKVLGTKQVH